MATRTRSRARAGASRSGMRASRNGVVEIFTRPHHHIVVRILSGLVRLRVELTVVAVLGAGQIMLTKAGMAPRWALLTLVVMVGIVLAVPVTHRYVVARFWAVSARHRIRKCFVQTRTMTYDGKLPYLWWSRPSPVGESVRVWLPAGLSVKDIDDVTDKLAAACYWAREARVQANTNHAARVTIAIIRRDPLSTTGTVTPHAVDELPEPVTSDGTVIPLPLREDITTADHDSASEPTPIRRGQVRQANRPVITRRVSGKNTPTTDTGDTGDTDTHENTPTVVGLNGMDVSDYV